MWFSSKSNSQMSLSVSGQSILQNLKKVTPKESSLYLIGF